MTKAAVDIRDLYQSYQESGNEHEIFADLNFTVAQGEFIVLLGRSGSGKSTMLNLISGIDFPASGELLVNGVDLTILSEHERTLFRRRNIGFVFQSYNLIPTLTVEENLLLPLELIKRDDVEGRQRVAELVDSLGLGNRLQSYPDRLSGGEQQRISIVRSLVHDPALILADEPTGNLDLETGQQVLALLDNLASKRGKTLIMATHSREVIGKADRIVTIKDKGIVAITDDSDS